MGERFSVEGAGRRRLALETATMAGKGRADAIRSGSRFAAPGEPVLPQAIYALLYATIWGTLGDHVALSGAMRSGVLYEAIFS